MTIEELCILTGVPLMVRIVYPRTNHDAATLGTHTVFLDPERCEIFEGGDHRVRPQGNGYSLTEGSIDLVTKINDLRDPVIKCRSFFDARVVEIPVPKLT